MVTHHSVTVPAFGVADESTSKRGSQKAAKIAKGAKIAKEREDWVAEFISPRHHLRPSASLFDRTQTQPCEAFTGR